MFVWVRADPATPANQGLKFLSGEVSRAHWANASAFGGGQEQRYSIGI